MKIEASFDFTNSVLGTIQLQYGAEFAERLRRWFVHATPIVTLKTAAIDVQVFLDKASLQSLSQLYVIL